MLSTPIVGARRFRVEHVRHRRPHRVAVFLSHPCLSPQPAPGRSFMDACHASQSWLSSGADRFSNALCLFTQAVDDLWTTDDGRL